MIKFAETTDTIIVPETSKKLNSLWAITALGNSTPTFLFKLHNNTAGFNLAVLHFVRGHLLNCTFSDILETPKEQNETPLHLFFSVLPLNTYRTKSFLGCLKARSRFPDKSYFNRADFRKNDFLTIFSKLLLKYYWGCKQRQCLSNLQNAKTVLKSELSIIIHCNLKIRMIYENSGINFNRE
jgi:hypothetical protein